jgi:parallel beta-helix repeat protein
VLVSGGTYSGIVGVPVSGTAKAPIVFSAAPGATVILTGQKSGFSLWRKRWVTVNGFTISNTRDFGIRVQYSSFIRITGNHVSGTGRRSKGEGRAGISLGNVNYSTIAGNSVDHASAYGINLLHSHHNVVRGNISLRNAFVWQRAASGIRLFGSTANTVVGNITTDNEDSGIEFDTSADNLAQDNLSYENGDHGIDVYRSPGARIVRNTVYQNLTAGINVEGGSTGAAITTNVSVDNAIGGPRNHSNIRVETGSTAGTTLDYDHVFLSNPDVSLIWDNVNYLTLSAFQAATGQEPHGVEGPPHWIRCNVPGADGAIPDGPKAFLVGNNETCQLIQAARRRNV